MATRRQNIETKHSKFVAAIAKDERPVILSVRDLEKTYDVGKPTETRALRGVNMEITLGEIVVIFGPSGSGKSTLLNILAGLDEPTNGSIIVDNKDLAKMTAKEKVQYHQYKVGMVFQSYNLVQAFTVIQNITMPARLAGFKKSEYVVRGLDLLRQFKLEELANKLPQNCSGGQQQRIGIMRALINRPAFIIADEPTGNLDSQNSRHVMELFQNLNHDTNTTMIVVTHDPSLFAIADRVVHVLDGKVVKQTILTSKAKVNLDTIDVAVEIKLRKKGEGLNEAGTGTERKKIGSATGIGSSQPTRQTFRAFADMLAQHQTLPPRTQHILSVLTVLLTDEQKSSLDHEELMLLLKAADDRVAGRLDHAGLQQILDRPFAEGGVGLYRQTAERVASGLEAVLQLGVLQKKPRTKKLTAKTIKKV